MTSSHRRLSIHSLEGSALAIRSHAMPSRLLVSLYKSYVVPSRTKPTQASLPSPTVTAKDWCALVRWACHLWSRNWLQVGHRACAFGLHQIDNATNAARISPFCMYMHIAERRRPTSFNNYCDQWLLTNEPPWQENLPYVTPSFFIGPLPFFFPQSYTITLLLRGIEYDVLCVDNRVSFHIQSAFGNTIRWGHASMFCFVWQLDNRSESSSRNQSCTWAAVAQSHQSFPSFSFSPFSHSQCCFQTSL